MKNITLPCTRDHLYLIAKISWLTCHKYLNFFNHYNKAYNEEFLAKCELEIDMAQQQLDTRFLNSIGICYKEMARYEDALSHYNAALKIVPNDVKILYNKVLAHLDFQKK